MKQGIKIILIVICFLFFFFCLSGVVMTGDFSMHGTLEQKEHFLLVQNIYKISSLFSLSLLIYLIFFVKVAR
jgi:cytochrome b subunit of formate dehydrogenase